MTTTLTTIAATIRKHSPGAMTESLHTGPAGLGYFQFSSSHDGREKLRILPDDIAEAVLRDAMVRDGLLLRATQAWWVVIDGSAHWFQDSDHGGSLGACWRAWRFAKGITCDTHPSA